MLILRDIRKQYKTGSLVQNALDGVSLSFRDNEFVTVLGPSGAGKTTLLNIIGGLDHPDKGELIISGISTKKYKDKDWNSYRNHRIGFIFQSYNLIPHRNILFNVEIALTIAGVKKAERKARAMEALRQVGLADQAHKKPGQLSGGQQQRVAIARALINNPEIVLADEPTGALDSATGLQIMELLREVAKDRLVIMVTHNNELAEEYSTRIVRLKDGKVVSDTNPYDAAEEKPVYESFGKAEMGASTAFSLSLSNLKTKLARTLLVSFAGSIGIIGIALILAMSSGVNKYIDDTEQDLLSEYPLEIDKASFSPMSFMTGMHSDAVETVRAERAERETADDPDAVSTEVRERQVLGNMMSTISSNDLVSLRDYLENESDIAEYTNAIEYSYDLTPQIYREENGKIWQVNPNKFFDVFGIDSGSSFMSSYSQLDVFFALPTENSLYSSQYELTAGSWPTSADECIVILGSDGTVSDFILYTLGLKDISEMEKMLEEAASSGNPIRELQSGETWDPQELLGIEFEALSPAETYSCDENAGIYVDRSGDAAFMQQALTGGRHLRVTGVAQPVPGTSISMLMPGIWYTPELIDGLIDDAENSPVVQAQLADPDVNVLTGRRFDEEEETSEIDFAKFISVDEDALMDVLADNVGALLSSTSDDLAGADWSEVGTVAEDLTSRYLEWASSDPATDYEKLPQALGYYLERGEGKEVLSDSLRSIGADGGDLSEVYYDVQDLIDGVKGDFRSYARRHHVSLVNYAGRYLEWLTSDAGRGSVQKHLADTVFAGVDDTSSEAVVEAGQALLDGYDAWAAENHAPRLSVLTSSFASYLKTEDGSAVMKEGLEKILPAADESDSAETSSLDLSGLSKAIRINLDPSELESYLTAYMSQDTQTADGNLKKFGYVKDGDIAEIVIYPKDFEAKEEAVAIIDNYNAEQNAAGNKEKVITYVDMVGVLMSSFTDILNAITYVMIALIAVSLVVSSVMIGVITYISVFERRKEIGILRAIGASKLNVSEIFISETLIIGFSAGLMGVIVAYILLVPINAVLHNFIGDSVSASAFLPILSAARLVLLSVVLTIISGLIPSGKAARNDPAVTLRTE